MIAIVLPSLILPKIQLNKAIFLDLSGFSNYTRIICKGTRINKDITTSGSYSFKWEINPVEERFSPIILTFNFKNLTKESIPYGLQIHIRQIYSLVNEIEESGIILPDQETEIQQEIWFPII